MRRLSASPDRGLANETTAKRSHSLETSCLLVESDPALSKILLRELKSRTVLTATTIDKALRILEAELRLEVIVSSHKRSDGAAKKLFALAMRRWPNVRRVLSVDGERLKKSSIARAGAALSGSVVCEFEELRNAVG